MYNTFWLTTIENAYDILLTREEGKNHNHGYGDSWVEQKCESSWLCMRSGSANGQGLLKHVMEEKAER